MLLELMAETENPSKRMRLESWDSKDHLIQAEGSATTRNESFTELGTRKYQEEALVAAKERNVIVRMPTGSGKTHVACMLIKDMLSTPLKHGETESKKAIFLVCTTLLVHQHASTLSQYVDKSRLKSYYGLGCDNVESARWSQDFDSLDVAVMTAQIFLNQLRAGTWSMERCGLIIFDECHNATANHPYVTILKEVFHQMHESKRPRILGLTASPIQDPDNERAKKNLTKLMGVLHSEIHETKLNVEELHKFSPRPKEEIFDYEPLRSFVISTTSKVENLIKSCEWVWEKLLTPDPKHPEIPGKMYRSFEDIKMRLGSIGGDAYLYLWLLEFKDHVQKHPLEPYKSIRDDLSKVRELEQLWEEVVVNYEDLPKFSQTQSPFASKKRLRPGSDDTRLIFEISESQTEYSIFSPKLSLLLSLLSRYSTDRSKCLVFCQTRICCDVLCEIIKKFSGYDWIRPGWLVGHGDSRDGVKREHQTEVEADMKVREQVNMMDGFKKGDINLLVSTSIAEEGIDVPSCNLVIRFDPPTRKLVGYVQSRGRARQHNSHYLLFAAKYSDERLHYETWQKEEQALLEKFRKQEEFERKLEEESNGYNEILVIPETKAYLTGPSAIILLAAVCAIHKDVYTPDAKPIYEEVHCTTVEAKYQSMFQYRLRLPIITPLTVDERIILSGIHPSKKMAKQHAAFIACQRLLERDKIDKNLQPVKNLKKFGRNHEYLIDGNGERVVVTKLPEIVDSASPNVWGDIWQPEAECTFNVVEMSIDGRIPIRVGFICGKKIEVKEFGWKDRDYEDETVIFRISFSRTLTWRDATKKKADLVRLDVWNRKCFMVSLNRRYAREDIAHSRESNDGEEPWNSQHRLLWLLAPLTADEQIDWSLIDEPWTPFPIDKEKLNLDQLRDTTIILPHRPLTNRLYKFGCVRSDISTSSNVQLPLAKKKHWKNYDDWFAVTRKHHNSVRALPEAVNYFVELHGHPKCRNFLSILTDDAPQETCTYLVPDILLAIDQLGKDLWRVFRYAPSFTRKIHDRLLTTVASNELDLGFISKDILEMAMTLPICGIGYDYERLEYLGDSFAKLASSVHLYMAKDKHGAPLDEGHLSARRQASISNFTFRKRALESELHRFFSTFQMRIYAWKPPTCENFNILSFDGSTVSRRIPRRTLSDVTEAIMGAAYLEGGIDGGLKASQRLGLSFGKQEEGNWEKRWRERWEEESRPVGIALANLEKSLGYKWNDSSILLNALTHRSYISADACYEREEFLGDAVIDLFVASKLYSLFPSAPPSRLTVLRSMLVCNPTLSYLSFKLSLHNHLRVSPASLAVPAIASAYSDYLTFKHINATWLSRVPWTWDPPKIVGDIFEAVIGALFWDSKFDVVRTWEVLERVFGDLLDVLEDCEKEKVIGDPWSVLTRNIMQEMKCNQWKVVHSESEPGLRLAQIYFHNLQIGSGTGRTKALAKMAAADRANAWWLLHRNEVKKEKGEDDDKVCDCEYLRDEKRRQKREEKKREREALASTRMEVETMESRPEEVGAEGEPVPVIVEVDKETGEPVEGEDDILGELEGDDSSSDDEMDRLSHDVA